MNTKLLEATDVASGTFSLLLLLTLAATVLLFMGTGWVTRKWKLPLTMAGLVMGVSAFTISRPARAGRPAVRCRRFTAISCGLSACLCR